MAEFAAGLAWVALGSALGGAARFIVSELALRWLGGPMPWGTLAVNVTGAFALGALAAAGHGGTGALAAVWQLAAVGVLGSYTTVSSFSLQTLSLWRAGAHGAAMANVALSLALGLAAAAAGLAVAS
ncbi:MAG: CrcB family protein [Rhodospirillales bacterium]